jgi:hypothetical protein
MLEQPLDLESHGASMVAILLVLEFASMRDFR